MRIFLTTIITGLLYILLTSLDFQAHKNAGDRIMIFFMILFPIFGAVCLYHFFQVIYKWIKKRPSPLTEILILCLGLNLTLFLVTLPDYISHQTELGYSRYTSYWEFFKTNVLEATITAICFSIVIPLVDICIQRSFVSSKNGGK